MLSPEDVEAIAADVAKAVVKRILAESVCRHVTLRNLVNSLDTPSNRLATGHNFIAHADSGRKYTITVHEVEKWPM